jgi:hypothetical protein
MAEDGPADLLVAPHFLAGGGNNLLPTGARRSLVSQSYVPIRMVKTAFSGASLFALQKSSGVSR